jgi:hypothetical protein
LTEKKAFFQRVDHLLRPLPELIQPKVTNELAIGPESGAKTPRKASELENEPQLAFHPQILSAERQPQNNPTTTPTK